MARRCRGDAHDSTTQWRKRSHTRRHEHHLIEAKKHAIGDPTLSIPRKYQELVVAIPGWLRPVVRIVSGSHTCADVVEQERKAKRWLKEEVVSSRVEVYFDPAIVIDDYVLTGWGEQEIAEADRQREHDLGQVQFAAASPKRQITIIGGAHALRHSCRLSHSP